MRQTGMGRQRNGQFDGSGLKEARQAAGMSQTDLSEYIGVAQPRISLWERGKYEPTPEQLKALFELFPELKGKQTIPEDDGEVSGFGRLVRDRRFELGLSSAELAEKASVSVPTIYNIESGKIRNPRPRTKRRLKQVLGLEKGSSDPDPSWSIQGLGEIHDFDPADESQWPTDAGIYVLYDVSDRPVYVGQGSDIRNRLANHYEKFWYKSPIVEKGMYIRVPDAALRRQIETLLIKFLKSNAVINVKNVDR